MKILAILKKLITFYFYITLLGFLFLLIGVPIMYYKEFALPITSMQDYNVSNLSTGKFIAIYIVTGLIFFQFLKALYLFNNSLKDLSTGKYFSELVIDNFKKMGAAFLICGVSFWLFEVILRFTLINDLRIGVHDGFLLLSILGLFFLFLSEVFAKARITKQENDLTI